MQVLRSTISVSDIILQNVDFSSTTDENILRLGTFGTLLKGTLSFTNCKTINVTFPSTLNENNTKYVGGLIGYTSSGTCTIIGCSFEQSSAINISIGGSSTFSFGGIIGYTNSSTTTITDCSTNANSIEITLSNTVQQNVGGIVGWAINTVTLTNNHVSNYNRNDNASITINNSINTAQYTGGLCGYADNSNNLQTFNNNTCRISLLENNSSAGQNRYLGTFIGFIKNGTTTPGRISGSGNAVISGSSLTITGSGSNTHYGSSNYFKIVGGFHTSGDNIPTGFCSNPFI